MGKGRKRIAGGASSFSLQMLDVIALYSARIFVFLLGLLPTRLSRLLARGFVEILLRFMPRARAVGMKNLSLIFPEKSEQERRRILNKSFWVLANNLSAFSKIHLLNKESASHSIEYSSHKVFIDKLRAHHPDVGVMIAALHFGSFELLIQFHALFDRPFSILARGFGLPRTDEWWNQRRGIFGNKVFYRKGGYSEIVRRLTDGEDVAILFDQNVKANHAIFIDFFGIPAATTKGLGLAALRTRCPIVFAALVETSSGSYTIIREEIKNPVDLPLSNDEKIARIMNDLHRVSEQVIRAHPEHWMWIHRRYKTRPNGEKEDIYSHIS